jgi:hypothetical protein
MRIRRESSRTDVAAPAPNAAAVVDRGRREIAAIQRGFDHDAAAVNDRGYKAGGGLQAAASLRRAAISLEIAALFLAQTQNLRENVGFSTQRPL